MFKLKKYIFIFSVMFLGCINLIDGMTPSLPNTQRGGCGASFVIYRYRCFVCNEGQNYGPALLKHIQLNHPTNKAAAQCSYCLRVCNNRPSCLRHMRDWHADKLYLCVYCSLKVKSSKKLLKHIRLNHKKIKTWICTYCGDNFENKTAFQNHIQLCQDLTDTLCAQASSRAIMPMGFSREAERVNALAQELMHDYSKNEEDLTNEIALELQRDFGNVEQPSAVIDLTSLEQEEKKKFACNIGDCDRSYTKKQGLKKHLVNDHADIAMYLCECKEACTQKYTSEELILKHCITKHKKDLGEAGLLRLAERLKNILGDKSNDVSWLIKSYFCDIEGCNKRFSRKSYLKTHMKAQHGDGFVCTEEGCRKRYSSKKNLNNHMKSEHGDGFVCNLCQKKLSNKRSVKRHKHRMHKQT